MQTKKKVNTTVLLFIVLALFCFYAGYVNINKEKAKIECEESCTPVSTLKEEKNLDLNSAFVKDLYSKVKTDIREDLASPVLDESLKLYLAYRQIPNSKIYESNCNLFNDGAMLPYTCKESASFIPHAFKEETLAIEYKKLFGRNATFTFQNIQLSNVCLGGYQYIKSRGEYVEGSCSSLPTTTSYADKKLIKAVSKESTITLTESVTYYGSNLPSELKSGTYEYKFRLDPDYNYIYISKELIK